MRLFLDDLRPCPDGWTLARTVAEAQAVLVTNRGAVTHASLDNDLGPGTPEGRALCAFMAENDLWPAKGIRVHSSNAPAALAMLDAIRFDGPYGRPLGRRFGDWSDVEPFGQEHGVG